MPTYGRRPKETLLQSHLRLDGRFGRYWFVLDFPLLVHCRGQSFALPAIEPLFFLFSIWYSVCDFSSQWAKFFLQLHKRRWNMQRAIPHSRAWLPATAYWWAISVELHLRTGETVCQFLCLPSLCLMATSISPDGLRTKISNCAFTKVPESEF